MPYSEEHKQETRQKILESARRLFNRKGFTEVSIEEVMESAGLTDGRAGYVERRSGESCGAGVREAERIGLHGVQSVRHALEWDPRRSPRIG